MGKYTVITGQNIYDVALSLTGSIEGVIDLMMCNPDLDLERTLQAGDELFYTDGFVIDPDIVASYKNRKIVPAGGQRAVYPKVFEGEMIAQIYLGVQQVSASFEAAGNGTLQIDWGDNSPAESIELSVQRLHIPHRFDNRVGTQRRVRFYGSCNFTLLDMSAFQAENIMLMDTVDVEKFVMNNGSSTLNFVQMLQGTYSMDLSGLKVANLLPVAECRELMTLDMWGADIRTKSLDAYLIALVRRHYGRRSCSLRFSQTPLGEYREPRRDEDMNYVIESGMEAVWLLTHEESWNEAGAWTITAGEKVYTYKAPTTPQPQPQPEPDPAPEPAPEPEPDPAPQPEPEPSPQPDPTPEPVPPPQPEPDPAPEPEPQPEPSPQPPQPDPVPQPEPDPAPHPDPVPKPNPGGSQHSGGEN